MGVILIIACLAAVALGVPVYVQTVQPRAACGTCRYELSGLTLPCQCPECGMNCTVDDVVRRVVWHWRAVPRVLAAMLPVAFAPLLPSVVYAGLLCLRYDWPWHACWYQSAERELAATAPFGLPFAINAVLLTMRLGRRTTGAAHPRFWRRVVLTNGLGFVGLTPFAAAAYWSRFHDWGGLTFVPALGVLLAMFVLGWALDAGLARAARNEGQNDNTRA